MKMKRLDCAFFIKIYLEWRDVEGCGSAYARMYNTIGGHSLQEVHLSGERIEMCGDTAVSIGIFHAPGVQRCIGG